MKKVLREVQNFRTRRVFKQFAAKNHFVYFGSVSARSDEHEMVLGATASTKHTDSFFTVGTFLGHDITLLERRNTVTFPGKPSATYAWLIAQVDLKRGSLPHMFIDFHHHDETFFANLAVAFTKLQDMSPAFGDIGARVLVDPLLFAQARNLLTPEIVAGLVRDFRHTSLEIKDDQLFIYANNLHPTVATLEHILKLAAWLADQINNTKL